VAFHHREAAARSQTLLAELARSAPLEKLEVSLDHGRWIGAELPSRLGAGSSTLALGFYEGGNPSQVSVRAFRGSTPIALRARKRGRADARGWARMALADASTDAMPGALPGREKENRRAYLRAAASVGVVTQESAGVAVDRHDGFAMDRLALAKRWGSSYYRRLAPRGERLRSAGWRFPPFELRTSHGGGRARTGEVDAPMIARLVRAHVIPVARHCYERQLRHDPQLGGKALLHIEIARGEVQFAAVDDIALGLRPIESCLVDAVYAMPAPKVAQGDDPELIHVARYPLSFRHRENSRKKGVVQEGTPREPRLGDPFGDPLEGLPE
jgi:hypothetical protein